MLHRYPTEVQTGVGSEEDNPVEERFDPGEVTELEEVGEIIAFAAVQRPPNSVSQLDLYRRNKFSQF